MKHPQKFFVIGLILLHFSVKSSTNNNKLKTHIPASIMFLKSSQFSKYPGCAWLKSMKHQYRLCKKDPGLSDVLLNARKLSIQNCEDQFRYDRWNCSRKPSTFKRIFKETAILQAFAASAITFSVARACAEGSLKSCHCAKEPKKYLEVQNLRWGGCGDNISYGKKVATKFLGLKRPGDHLTDILRHNAEIGLKILVPTKVCRCQGVSGSCTIKICWKKLSNFEETAKNLKLKYQGALKIRIGNSNSSEKIKKKIFKSEKLLFLSKSPTFCKTTSFRQCLNTKNCETLCCQRGYDTKLTKFSKLCNCRWKKDCCQDMKCDNCTYVKEEYFCKP